LRPDSRPSPNRRILVAHDGELDDVCRILETIGGRFLERRGRSGASMCDGDWGVVIASPQALLGTRFSPDAMPLRIAIVEAESRTALSLLRRAGVERIVRRPVHAAALRGLLLHTVYCGPEKRRRQRVSVGAPVRFRTGLWPRNAILSEASIRGCRLLTRHAPRRDASITVTLPAKLTGGRSLAVRGRVVRTGPASGEDVGTQAIAVVFSELSRPVLKVLMDVVNTHARGPAVLPGAGRATPARRDRRTAADPVGAPVDPSPASEASADAPVEAPPAVEEESDRRSARRREYERSIVALGAEAARILIGMDISLGGMRVAPHPDLQVGDRLQLALHVRARSEPLVVEARVERNDGERGLVLHFVELAENAAECLAKMVDELPPLSEAEPVPEGEPASAGETVVSEILEHAGG
jgi:hypothetical protein